jgi:hypothetical protein
MNPLSEASAVGKQRKRNSQELENLRWTHYKTFIECKENSK